MDIKKLIGICLKNNIDFSIVPMMSVVSDDVYDIRFTKADKVSHFTGTLQSLNALGERADDALEIQILSAFTALSGLTEEVTG